MVVSLKQNKNQHGRDHNRVRAEIDPEHLNSKSHLQNNKKKLKENKSKKTTAAVRKEDRRAIQGRKKPRNSNNHPRH